MSFPFVDAPLDPGRYEPEGIYLSRPFAGSQIVTQLWAENPSFYSQFFYDGVPLRGHNGIDFGSPTGTDVLATDDGEVIYVGYEAGGFGVYVKLQHRWGESLYAHMGRTSVGTGGRVKRGQVLGISDNSGGSFGPHLHFGIRIFPYVRSDGWGGFTDPLPYMDPNDLVLPRSLMGTLVDAGTEVASQLPRMAVSRPRLRQP